MISRVKIRALDISTSSLAVDPFCVFATLLKAPKNGPTTPALVYFYILGTYCIVRVVVISGGSDSLLCSLPALLVARLFLSAAVPARFPTRCNRGTRARQSLLRYGDR